MANVAVIGAQWGDEGKGKIVDWLSERAEVVVRFQGGHNAGHTLVIGNQTYKLALLPSGVVRKGKLSIIGNGVVVDPWHFLEEVKKVTSQGVSVTPETLKIANHAVLILPLHRDLDGWREDVPGTIKIGTTRRGIGPAYEDKVGRRAIRVGDLAEPDVLEKKVNTLLAHHNALRQGLGRPTVDAKQLLADLIELAPKILPFAEDVWERLDALRADGKRILFEGAKPVTAWRKLPLLSHQEQFLTAQGPMKIWFDRARALEADRRVLQAGVDLALEFEQGGTVLQRASRRAGNGRLADDYLVALAPDQLAVGAGAGELRRGRVPLGGPGREPPGVRRARQHGCPSAAGRRARAARLPVRVGAVAIVLPDGCSGAAQRSTADRDQERGEARRDGGDDRRDAPAVPRRARERSGGRRAHRRARRPGDDLGDPAGRSRRSPGGGEDCRCDRCGTGRWCWWRRCCSWPWGSARRCSCRSTRSRT